MSDKTIVEGIRDFIKGCPYLNEFHKGISVDYLGEKTSSYSIEGIPTQPVIKRYIDGSAEKQYLFVFSSREAYGNDVFQNLENLGFYEHFSKWIEQQSILGNLPNIGEDREAKRIECLTTGYTGEVMDMQMDKCRYQIQCRLVYFEKSLVDALFN
jgi:hypothetical protein|nr:MAG TPA: Minor capsid protein from bacteriophage [Caudoviricetes sp.]